VLRIGKRVGLKTKSVWVLKGNQVGTDAKLRQKRLTFIPRRLPFNEDITSSELNALTNDQLKFGGTDFPIVLCHRNHDEVSLRPPSTRREAEVQVMVTSLLL